MMGLGESERIGIAGAGNVGSALAFSLAATGRPARIEIAARSRATAAAARIDALSAYPEAWRALVDVECLSGTYDVVVITAGVQPGRGSARLLLYQMNLAIAKWFLRNVNLTDGVFVLVGTPVDELTGALLRLIDGDQHRVIGFGGELDRSRLRSILHEQQDVAPGDAPIVIGEHGERTIPVFSGLEHYPRVRDAVRNTLADILGATGSARNLASGVQLARLIQALQGETSTHCVSTYLDQYALPLTWPCRLGHKGVEGLDTVHIQGPARKDFDALLESKRAEEPSFSRGIW